MKSNRLTHILILCVGVLVGVVVAQNFPKLSAQDGAKGPTWLHAHELRVRKAGEVDFTDKTKKISLEVFKDENNGNIIYISENGDIAVVPGK